MKDVKEQAVINAERRGVQTGSDEARKQPELRGLPESEVISIAGRVWTSLKASGYAHIDPEQDFVEGFVSGVRQYFLLVS